MRPLLKTSIYLAMISAIKFMPICSRTLWVACAIVRGFSPLAVRPDRFI
jgi:hypothetical protein